MGGQDTPADAPWVVRGAGFAFNVACKFVVSSSTVVSATTKDDKADGKNSMTRVWGSPQGASDEDWIFAKLIQLIAPLKSVVEIKIYREQGGSAPSSVNTAQHHDEEEDDGWSEVQIIIRPVPTALWGRYDYKTDPSPRDASQDAMLSSETGTKRLMTVVDIHAHARGSAPRKRYSSTLSMRRRSDGDDQEVRRSLPRHTSCGGLP